MENNENWIFLNPETYPDDEVNLVLEQILTEYSRFVGLDMNMSILSYSEREKSQKFFEKVLDQHVYFSQDHSKIRRYIIDWYSSHKTQITKARRSTDLNLLTSEELNEFMVSYGFPYPRNIISRSNRIQFLSNLIKNYQKKGTSETIANIVSLYGLRNVLISEWWIRYDSRRSREFFARSNVVHPEISRNDKSLELEKSYEEFILNNPHWQMTYSDLSSAYNKSSDLSDGLFYNKVSLPSITNIISIETHSNLVELELACAVFQRKIEESLDFWIGYSLIPLKLSGLAENTIVTSMLNDPPTPEELSADLPWGRSNFNGDTNIYLVGPSPTGAWENQGFEKKLVVYEHATTSWRLHGRGADVNYSVFLRDDSVLHKNSLLILQSGTSDSWTVYSHFKKDVCIRTKTNQTHSSHYRISTRVYNGEEWIDLERPIYSSLMLNRDENLFRDIALNSFTSLYSLLEIQLAFAYLHNGPYSEESDQYHFNYHGNYTPLDSGYVRRLPGTNIPTPRNDIDTLYYSNDAYSVISEEYKNLVFDQDKLTPDNTIVTFRHNTTNTTPRTLQDSKKIEFKDKFTQQNQWNNIDSYTIGNTNLYAQTRAEQYLKAINPEFFKELTTLLESESNELVLENMMVDFETYVINTMQLIESPFAYIQNGGQFFNKKLLPVLDFFKPFRVKILDFLTKFDIYNPLMDSLLINERIDFNVSESFVEKPFPRNLGTTAGYSYLPNNKSGVYPPVLDYVLGHGLATEDYAVISINHTINEPVFGTLDTDGRYNSLDLSMKDAFFITVTEGGDVVYDYKTDENITVYTDPNDIDAELEIEPVDE